MTTVADKPKFELSERIQQIKPSATIAVSMRAKALKAAGEDIIGLGAGEPDFDTPEHIKQAAIEAINNNQTRYTPIEGTLSLREAIVDKFQRENGFSYTPEQILVSTGAKQCLYNIFQTLINPGDEVIILSPYWVSYPDMTKLCGGKPVVLQSSVDNQYKVSPEQIKNAITDRTKLIVFNSPSNPSGIAYNKQDWQAYADVLLQHPNIMIATDDIYEHILWRDEPFNNILNICPELYDRTIVVNGVSKGYAMTGWRIGYAAGPADLIKAMKKIQSQSTSNTCTISQYAAEAALRGDQSALKTMLTAFKERHDFVVGKLQSIDGVECLPGDGTFYVFPNVQKIIDKLGLENDVAFSEHLLNSVGVAVVPGSAFGAPGSIRISFASSMEVLSEALERLTRAMS